VASGGGGAGWGGGKAKLCDFTVLSELGKDPKETRGISPTSNEWPFIPQKGREMQKEKGASWGS